jgi:serine/threonine-protein phosphatase 6 regulatory ankyrin repeat subunit B
MHPPELAQRVIEACFAGDEATVRELVTAEPALAAARFRALDSTALHISAHRGFQGIVELLLAHGADPNAREGCSATTPLHWAAEAGHRGIAEALVAHGAELSPVDDWHAQTPLDWAVWVVQSPHLHVDRAGTAAWLQQRGARPSLFSCIAARNAAAVRALVARDPRWLDARLGVLHGEATPLLFALERRLSDMSALLLELGANPSHAGARGLSALAFAHLAGDEAMRAELAARGVADDLSACVVRGDFERARALLAAEPGALHAGGSHARLLPALVQLDGAGAVAFLLAASADPAAALPCLDFDEWVDSWPALLLAARARSRRCAELLLDAGADLDARAPRSRSTALHVAAASSAEDLVELLLVRGAEANARDRGGATPLHRAASAGGRACVERLLASGADRTARDAQFHATPAGWAQYGGHGELAALLQEPAR